MYGALQGQAGLGAVANTRNSPARFRAPGCFRPCSGHEGLSPSVAYLGGELDPADVLAEEPTPRVCRAFDILARLIVD